MYNIIPLLIILLSLFVIIIIIVRKFPVLASLDLDTVQAEKEAKVKEQIVGKRLKRNFVRYYSKFFIFFKPWGVKFLKIFKNFYEQLVNFKENYNKNENTVLKPEEVDKMTSEAKELVKEEKNDEAEKKFIDIISKDSQNIKAFDGLAKLYIEKKQFVEAKQTFEHILRLLEHDEVKNEISSINDNKIDKHYLSSVYYELAKVCQTDNKIVEALINIKKAVEIEPSNPRYLDMKLEISIINKDKGTAWEALQKLKKVNPENNKLSEFADKIKEL